MEPITKASEEQEAQPVEQGNVQESTDSSADVGQLIADAKNTETSARNWKRR